MANEEHLAILRQGVEAWNAWRTQVDVGPDLTCADLRRAELRGVNLRGAKLTKATLLSADLRGATLDHAHLDWANLLWANLNRASLRFADLEIAYLYRANLHCVDLFRANLREANLAGADLRSANLARANLFRSNLFAVNFRRANLDAADLRETDLQNAILMRTSLVNTDFTGSYVYGISAWNLDLSKTIQNNMVISNPNDPEITVDNLEVAQFIYLLLHNEKIRDVIDTITSKTVLILGRFSEERKPVLDALREVLRGRDLLPIVFDSSIPASRDVTETVKILAGLARFVVADVTDATEVRVELHHIVRDYPSLPVQPILLHGREEFVSLSGNLVKFPGVLPTFEYESQDHLLANLDQGVIEPVEVKVRALEGQRKAIEAELAKSS
jgi:uncharacterized protein YjbI with pentapeptide repeats